MPSSFSHVIIEIPPNIFLNRSGLEKDIFGIPQWLWTCHFINFVLAWIQIRSQQYGPGWLHSFLHNAFYYTDLNDCIIFCTTYFTTLYKIMYNNSRLLQAVISGAGDGKFYQLPPDKENPACYHLSEVFSEIVLYLSSNFVFTSILAFRFIPASLSTSLLTILLSSGTSTEYLKVI